MITVESTTPPDGLTEGCWHRYVIQSGNSIMEGKSLGTFEQVNTHAKELAEQINARNTWGQRKW